MATTVAATKHLVLFDALGSIALRAFSRHSAMTSLGTILMARSRAERNDDEVIQNSQNRDEVRNQVDGADGVGDDAGGEELGVPGCSGVSVGEVQGIGLYFELLDAALPLPYDTHCRKSRFGHDRLMVTGHTI